MKAHALQPPPPFSPCKKRPLLTGRFLPFFSSFITMFDLHFIRTFILLLIFFQQNGITVSIWLVLRFPQQWVLDVAPCHICIISDCFLLTFQLAPLPTFMDDAGRYSHAIPARGTSLQGRCQRQLVGPNGWAFLAWYDIAKLLSGGVVTISNGAGCVGQLCPQVLTKRHSLDRVHLCSFTQSCGYKVIIHWKWWARTSSFSCAE